MFNLDISNEYINIYLNFKILSSPYYSNIMYKVPTFIHLRMHSEYSISDGIVRINDAIEKAVADSMPALALTDLSNLFGMVKFYEAMRSNGIKPIIGCEVWITNENDRGTPSRILLLCKSHSGYLLLCRLLSRAYRENQYHGQKLAGAAQRRH